MEGAGSSEVLVMIYQTTHRHIPEDHNFLLHIVDILNSKTINLALGIFTEGKHVIIKNEVLLTAVSLTGELLIVLLTNRHV
jgi:hypothetical protein